MNEPIEVRQFRLKLYPKDFAQVRDFYENYLQFPVINEWDRGDDDKGVMFDVGGTILELLSPEDGYKPMAGSDLSLEVPNVGALWEQMKDGNCIVHPIRDNPWRDTSFCIADPEGFAITFFTKGV
jgi:catechol 2,3-dioxygenase-like lactoylglutathione lyase family enzyme